METTETLWWIGCELDGRRKWKVKTLRGSEQWWGPLARWGREVKQVVGLAGGHSEFGQEWLGTYYHRTHFTSQEAGHFSRGSSSTGKTISRAYRTHVMFKVIKQ